MTKVAVGFLTVLFLFAVTVIPIYAAEATTPTLTPNGNMTLVDDYVIGETQYITVQTKNGNYFYIIIDRSGETENVHFLNKVDEADLLPLLDEEFDFNIGTEQETPEEPTEPVALDVTDKSEKQKEILTRGLVLAGIFAAVGGGIYIFSKRKPKTEKGKSKKVDEDADDTVSENTYVRENESDTTVTVYENDANEEDEYEEYEED